MASLKAIAELCFRQLFPNPSDETKLRKEDFVSSAKTVYAAAVWIRVKEEQKQNGTYEIPSYLLTVSDPLPVRGDELDISGLKALTSLPNDMWLQAVGDNECYVKTSFNVYRTLGDDDDSLESKKPYYPIGNKIKFPKGTLSNKLSITFAKLGSALDDSIEVDDSLGQIVRDKLAEMYVGKIGKADVTNNSNPEN